MNTRTASIPHDGPMIDDLVSACESAIRKLEPIWDDVQSFATQRMEIEFPVETCQEAICFDLIFAVSDVARAVDDAELKGKAKVAATIVARLLQAVGSLPHPLEVLPNLPDELVDEPSSWILAFLTVCRRSIESDPGFQFWNSLTLRVLGSYDEVFGTSFCVPVARLYLRYFQLLQQTTALSSESIINTFLEELNEFIAVASQIPAGTGSPITCTLCAKSLVVLGLPPGADLDQIRSAHKDLAKVWHPDRFRDHDERLKEKASKEFVKIQQAYEHLNSHYAETSKRASGHCDAAKPEQTITIAPESHVQSTQDKPDVRNDFAAREKSSEIWRFTKVGLLAIWRYTRAVFVTALVLFVAALVLLQIFMFLLQYWNREARRSGEERRGGLEFERLYGFLNSILWLPMQVWQGLVLLVSALFLLGIFAGQKIWEFASSNLFITLMLLGLVALSLAVWAIRVEYKLEFESAPVESRTGA